MAVGQGGETGEIEPRLLVVDMKGNVIATENIDAVIHFSTRTFGGMTCFDQNYRMTASSLADVTREKAQPSLRCPSTRAKVKVVV